MLQIMPCVLAPEKIIFTPDHAEISNTLSSGPDGITNDLPKNCAAVLSTLPTSIKDREAPLD